MAIGNAGEDQLTNKAHEKAQRVLMRAAHELYLVQKSKEQAEQVIAGIFVEVGWTLSLEWLDSS